MSINKYVNKTTGYSFEIHVAKHFENEGYRVYLNGILNDKKDNEIDLICWKNDNLLLIQCKDFIPNNETKLSHIDLRSFIDSCEDCMEEKNLKYSTLKRILISSNDILDFSAKKYLEDSNYIEYVRMQF